MLIYLISLPIWNLVLPTYAYWHFDDFSWGDTRRMEGEKKGAGKGGHDHDGEFDSSKITMKRWGDFEQERRLRGPASSSTRDFGYAGAGARRGHERHPSGLQYEEKYQDYP